MPDKAQGAFVTTSGYTKKAREEAEKEGFKRIGGLRESVMEGTTLILRTFKVV